MPTIIETQIPSNSLLNEYAASGAFTDCYCVDIPKSVSLECYIEAFYTTSVFKVERTILSLVTLKLAGDKEAIELSRGESEKYSIWMVESRLANQIILRDFTEKTRSWLMVENTSVNGAECTRLFFGSVVIPKKVSENGQAKFGFMFHALGRFHQFYSKALLAAAYKKLSK